jgi:membrane glycosyltransferase
MPDFPNNRSQWRTILRLLWFGALAACTVLLIAWQAFGMLQVNGLNALKLAIFAIFLVLLVPIVLSFWTAAVGFVIRLRGGDALGFSRARRDGSSQPFTWPRTAVVMPAYNEEPARVIAGLAATYQSLESTGLLPCFDFFLLSDTNNPDTWVREEVAFAELRNSVSDPERLHYRNRRENTERKTGNIADFCGAWGERYRYMVVLDADSIMTGTCLANLVRLMESNPQAGIIQTPPVPVNRRTLFGRLQQFATQAYNSIFITGLNFWQGGAGNYWGHNAIIRIQPFVQHCRLPTLPGKEPLGGQILSHDFVEAAFMRRAGWRVYLASDLGGSYEEVPPSLITYAARDRRWCQGNLQHTRLLLTPGLHIVNRLHLSLGVMAYLSSPLWLLLLLLSTVEALLLPPSGSRAVSDLADLRGPASRVALQPGDAAACPAQALQPHHPPARLRTRGAVRRAGKARLQRPCGNAVLDAAGARARPAPNQVHRHDTDGQEGPLGFPGAG